MTAAATTINDISSLFNDKSELYASSLPSYPKALFDFIASLSACSLAELFNFSHSWSATRRCMQECGDEFFNRAKLRVAKVWGDPEQKKLISTPLTVIASKL